MSDELKFIAAMANDGDPKAQWVIGELDRKDARIAALEAALKHLVSASKEPELASIGFDQPPEYWTAEDDALARALFEAKEVLRQ